MSGYDPFAAGSFTVETRTFSAPDPARDRVFPGEVWTPASGGEGRRASLLPLVIFCHGSGGNRKSAAYLCAHLAGHGYLVAAIDHSEVVAAELAPAADETAGQRAVRIDAGPKRMFVLRRADHQHFLDDVPGQHEALRAISLPGEATLRRSAAAQRFLAGDVGAGLAGRGVEAFAPAGVD